MPVRVDQKRQKSKKTGVYFHSEGVGCRLGGADASAGAGAGAAGAFAGGASAVVGKDPAAERRGRGNPAHGKAAARPKASAPPRAKAKGATAGKAAKARGRK